MFKIGDIVEITKESLVTGMLDFKEGKGYLVIGKAGALIRLCDEGGRMGWFHHTHFKLKEKEEEKVETLFKEGQVVWDLRNGRGVVESVNVKDIYPVKVKFDLRDVDGYAVTDSYTADGRFVTTQTVRSLYFSEPKIEAATEPLFEPTLEGGCRLAAVDKETSRFYRLVVGEETQEDIESVHGVVFEKELFDFYRLGEKIVFN